MTFCRAQHRFERERVPKCFVNVKNMDTCPNKICTLRFLANFNMEKCGHKFSSVWHGWKGTRVQWKLVQCDLCQDVRHVESIWHCMTCVKMRNVKNHSVHSEMCQNGPVYIWFSKFGQVSQRVSVQWLFKGFNTCTNLTNVQSSFSQYETCHNTTH